MGTTPTSRYNYPPVLMKQQEALHYAGGELCLKVLERFFGLTRARSRGKFVRYFKADIDEAVQVARLKGWPSDEEIERRLKGPSAC